MPSQPDFRQGPPADLQPLIAALRDRNRFEVRKFLMSLADVDSFDPSDRAHALHYCADYDDLEALTTLLRRGADPFARDIIGLTPLHRAAARNSPLVIPLLVEATRGVDLRDNHHSSPLHHAAGHRAHDAMRILASSPDRVNYRNGAGDTPLHVAASYAADITSVEILLAAGASREIPNMRAERPIHLAVQFNQEKVVRHLIRGGASTIGVTDTLHLPELVPDSDPDADASAPAKTAVYHTRWIRQLVNAGRGNLSLNGG